MEKNNINPRLCCFIGAALNLIGNIGGMISQNKNVNKQIAAQRAENEATRKYNKQMAEWQNAQNIAQWERENAYNDPKRQMERAVAAGLNPDLIYGNGGAAIPAANSPEMTSGAPATPTDMSNIANKRTIGDAISSGMSEYFQNRLAEANLEKIEAETNKANAEAKGQGITNEWIDKLNQNSIDLGNAKIDNLGFVNNLNQAQKEVLNKTVDKIHGEIDNLRASTIAAMESVKNMKFNQGIQTIRTRLEKDLTEAKIRQIATQNGLTVQEANRIKETLPFLISSMAADNELKTSQGMLNQQERMNKILQAQGIRIQNGNLILNGQILEHSAKNAQAYDKSTDSIGIVGKTIRVATQLIQDAFGGTIGNIIK